MNKTNYLESTKARIWEEIKDLPIVIYSKIDEPIAKIENGAFFLLSKSSDYFCTYGNPDDFYQGVADTFNMPMDEVKRKILAYKKKHDVEAKQND